jgi:hypothetical protein
VRFVIRQWARERAEVAARLGVQNVFSWGKKEELILKRGKIHFHGEPFGMICYLWVGIPTFDTGRRTIESTACAVTPFTDANRSAFG